MITRIMCFDTFYSGLT